MILYRLNPGSVNQNNALQLSRGVCCDENGNVCQYTLELATLGTITSITVKNRQGVDVTTNVSGVTDKKTLREALIKAINAAGGHLVEGGLTIIVDGSQYTIKGLGEVELVSLNNGATRTFTKACTSTYVCLNYFLVTNGIAGANVLKVGTTSTSLGAVTYPTTTASSLETIVDAIPGVDGDLTTVTADAEFMGYVVAVATDSQLGVFLNGEAPYQVQCRPQFTA